MGPHLVLIFLERSLFCHYNAIWPQFLKARFHLCTHWKQIAMKFFRSKMPPPPLPPFGIFRKFIYFGIDRLPLMPRYRNRNNNILWTITDIIFCEGPFALSPDPPSPVYVFEWFDTISKLIPKYIFKRHYAWVTMAQGNGDTTTFRYLFEEKI